jgi:hypothetical protein
MPYTRTIPWLEPSAEQATDAVLAEMKLPPVAQLADSAPEFFRRMAADPMGREVLRVLALQLGDA